MLILIFHFLLMDILHLPLLVVTVLFLEKKNINEDSSLWISYRLRIGVGRMDLGEEQ